MANLYESKKRGVQPAGNKPLSYSNNGTYTGIDVADYATVSVEVDVPTGIPVDHISITTQPTTRNYAQYDTLSLSGMVVTATFTDGVTANVTSVATASPANGSALNTSGTQTITVTYGGKTATTTVTVNAMTSIAVTTMPTKTAYKPNETLDLAGIVVTGTAGSLTRNVTSGCTFSPANGSTITTTGTIPVSVSYQGLTTSFNITSSSGPASLEDATWAQIQEAIQNGTLTDFAAVGDTKSVTISNKTYNLQLVSINDGSGTAGTYYPNHTADFIAVELLASTHNMNSSDTNQGGWGNSQMRSYLNSTIYNTLPSDLKSVIIQKTHMHTRGNKQTTVISVSDNLWLPTEWECVGNGNLSGDTANYNKHYSVFSTNASRIKKIVGSTSADIWWLASPLQNYSEYFCRVSATGGIGDNVASGTRGVALCLRIG